VLGVCCDASSALLEVLLQRRNTSAEIHQGEVGLGLERFEAFGSLVPSRKKGNRKTKISKGISTLGHTG